MSDWSEIYEIRRTRPESCCFVSDEMIRHACLQPWQVTAIEEHLRLRLTRPITDDERRKWRENQRRPIPLSKSSRQYGLGSFRSSGKYSRFISDALIKRAHLTPLQVKIIDMIFHQQMKKPLTEDELQRKYLWETATDLYDMEDRLRETYPPYQEEDKDGFSDEEDVFPPYKVQCFDDLRKANCLGLTIAAPFVNLCTSSIDKKRLVTYYVVDEEWMEPDVAREVITFAIYNGYCFPERDNIRITDAIMNSIQVPPGFDPALQVFMTQVWINNKRVRLERKRNSEEDDNHV